MQIKRILEYVEEELNKAMQAYPKIASYHEGYAVALEEIDELWDEIKKYKRNNPVNEKKILKEAIQAIAMLVRMLADCYNEEKVVRNE